MTEGIYKVIELVGSSEKSWEDAARHAVEVAGKHLKDLRVAEVCQMDMKVERGEVVLYRVKLKVSFRYHGSE